VELFNDTELDRLIKSHARSGRLWFNSRRRISSRVLLKICKALPLFCKKLHLVHLAAVLENWLKHNKSLFRNASQKLLIDALRTGYFDCFVDLGAHVGEQTFLAAKYVPVFAFEPDPHAFVKLQSSKDENECKNEVKLFNHAAYDFDGFSHLYFHKRGPENTTSSSLEKKKKNLGKENIVVETVDIGKFLKLLNYESILLKCDIEGAEYDVFRSLGRNNVFQDISLILTEFHDPKIPRQWVQSLRLTLFDRYRYGIGRRHLVEWL